MINTNKSQPIILNSFWQLYAFFILTNYLSPFFGNDLVCI